MKKSRASTSGWRNICRKTCGHVCSLPNTCPIELLWWATHPVLQKAVIAKKAVSNSCSALVFLRSRLLQTTLNPDLEPLKPYFYDRLTAAQRSLSTALVALSSAEHLLEGIDFQRPRTASSSRPLTKRTASQSTASTLRSRMWSTICNIWRSRSTAG